MGERTRQFPSIQVIGRAYWVMSREVTQSMYQEVMGQNPSQVPLTT